MKRSIEVIGARENNLKDINIEIPREKLVVVTGVSGSGKSSLVYDTIFAEGQRRFLESLSTYARSRLPLVKKPNVNMVLGLSPVVSIQQKRGISNPRSTVGTLTDIGSYLRLLMSIASKAFCPYCDHEIAIETTNIIAERIQTLPPNTQVEIRAPILKVYGEDYQYLFDSLRSQGYRKFRVNGKLVDSSEQVDLDENTGYQIEVVIDKFVIKQNIHKQLVDSLEQGLRIGQKFLRIEIISKLDKQTRTEFYGDFACPNHWFVAGELLPWYFTPNDLESACLTCVGLGTYMRAEPFLLVENENKSLREGAITNYAFNLNTKTFKRMHNMYYVIAYSMAKHYNFSLDTPFKKLPKEIKDLLFHGTQGEKFSLEQPPDHHVKNDRSLNRRRFPAMGQMIAFEGIIHKLHRWYKQYYSKKRNPNSVEENHVRKTMVEHTCPDCHGRKVRELRLKFRIEGRDIYKLISHSISDLLQIIENVKIPDNKKNIAEPVIHELLKRLRLMEDIGLGYLTLNRRSDTLSGGEIQRTALSTQIGSELMGMLYILDEPSIGLHPRDSQRLIGILKKMRDVGNSIIVVEHDTDTISAADYIIEMGPGPGIHGGKVTAEGSIDEIVENPRSLTGLYLNGTKEIEYTPQKRRINGRFLKIIGARENNLQDISVNIPLGVFICVTGVSGSGKSSLINNVLFKGLYAVLRDKRIIPGKHKVIEGIEYLSDVRSIDQSPIGRSSRSNPATYIGFFDKIRKLFADLPESEERKFSVSDFSYNSKSGGRCVHCLGEGMIRTQLQYMPDIESTCPDCKGARFQGEILEIEYRGKNIADILDLTVEEAIPFFSDVRLIRHKLRVMEELGLGYIKLGQSSNTLSGGEAQRIKLSKELGKIKQLKNNLYILDEPTTGLHLEDISKLLLSLNKLVDAGNTVLVIEHHLDVIKSADHIVDIGPGAAENGGLVVAQGTPEEVADMEESHTGKYLRNSLQQYLPNIVVPKS
ncbi:MAG: excinuclease ABC subunit UvrA [Candidatus Kariarchaeaceae archaeon]